MISCHEQICRQIVLDLPVESLVFIILVRIFSRFFQVEAPNSYALLGSDAKPGTVRGTHSLP